MKTQKKEEMKLAHEVLRVLLNLREKLNEAEVDLAMSILDIRNNVFMHKLFLERQAMVNRVTLGKCQALAMHLIYIDSQDWKKQSEFVTSFYGVINRNNKPEAPACITVSSKEVE